MRAETRASSLSEMILRVQTSRERHRIRDRRSALCIYRVVLRASPFKSHQGLRLHRAQAELRLNAFRLKHERQHRSVMSEEEEEEEEGIHYVEKTLFYWFSVREMANVLRDNLASIKTPYCPLRCVSQLPRAANRHQSCTQHQELSRVMTEHMEMAEVTLRCEECVYWSGRWDSERDGDWGREKQNKGLSCSRLS